MISDIKKLVRGFIPESVINFYHKIQAVLACIWYGFPGKKMTVIGVTGTNGKTTTCYMISQILDEAGLANAMATTIFFKSGKKYIRNNSKMTTLNPFVLQKFLRDAYNKGIRYAIIETTSHAIVQSRIWGIKYDSLVFTNITHDHLDYHGTFAHYLDAKLKLFRDNPQARAVINIDDANASKFKTISGNKVVTYSLEGKGDVNGRKIHLYEDGVTFDIAWFGNEIHTKLNIMGRFNIANSLAAFCVATNYNISPKSIVKAIANIQNIPGRLEYLDFGQNYKIVIDFAHTPDGLQKVFEAVRPVVRGRIIHIAGATGDRDKTKRPILGALAGKYADIAIVTDEDPGMENPEEIINAVAEGVVRGAEKSAPKILGKNFFKIVDRSKAIEFGLQIARKGDMVLITGKGHEEVMKVGEKLVPYSDKKAIEQIIKRG